MANFSILEDGGRLPSWIFKKFEILTAVTVLRANMRLRAKFHADRLNRFRDMAIFLFFKMSVKMGPSAIWDF